jgi:hypothetical protein
MIAAYMQLNHAVQTLNRRAALMLLRPVPCCNNKLSYLEYQRC